MIIRKDVVKLTLPILAEQTLIIAMGVVNTILASNLGEEVISAIGMIDSINNIFIAFFSALAIGGTVVVAQNTGRQDLEGAKKAALNAMLSGIAISCLVTIILFVIKKPFIGFAFGDAEAVVLENCFIYFNITLFTYPFIAGTSLLIGILRGSGDTKTPMKVTITMNALNLVLSFLLMYGLEVSNKVIHFSIPGLGIRGAAYGIAIARVVGMILITIALFKKFLHINIGFLKKFRFTPSILKTIFSIGLPSGLESLMFNGGKLITQVFIVGMGTVAITANTAAGSLFGILNIPGNALFVAATTLVGQQVGRRDVEKAKSTLKYLTLSGMVCLTLVNTLVFPFAKHLAGLYTDDPETISLTVTLLQSVAIAMPLLWSYSFIMPAGLKGGGDAKYTLKVSIVGMWAFRVVIGYLLAVPLRLGVMGVWIGMYIDWFIRGILFSSRFKKEKWIHTLE